MMRALIVDDEETIRESLKRLFEIEGIQATGAADGLLGQGALRDQNYDVAVIDLRMPRMGGLELLAWIKEEGIRTPVVMISAHGEIEDAVAALKSGASDYLVKPFDPAELIMKVKALAVNRQRADLLEVGSRTAQAGLRLVGESQSLKELRSLIKKVADSDTTVLLTGESGTGKEVIAREIHNLSARREAPFVAVNIGGVHEQLMESELFGHERGAFTGADSRQVGLFELAGDGSLFLDEIGEMPGNLQVKLLRVLQERRIRRLGGNRDIPIGARIISATNRDVEDQVKRGLLREDLYYRLNVVRIRVPPLRERREDIPLLSGFLLERLASRMGKAVKPLSDGALSALTGYEFPGNIRELENLLERALICSAGESIDANDLGINPGRAGLTSRQTTKNGQLNAKPPCPIENQPDGLAIKASPPHSLENSSLHEVERHAIEAALKRCGGNRTKAAAELGISRRTIINKIKAYDLN